MNRESTQGRGIEGVGLSSVEESDKTEGKSKLFGDVCHFWHFWLAEHASERLRFFRNRWFGEVLREGGLRAPASRISCFSICGGYS